MIVQRLRAIGWIGFLLIFLTGCLYPVDKEVLQLPSEESLQQVQAAVDAYYEDTDGLLPLKNSDSDTDIYIKYLIDFKKLVPNYLSQAPANSFEKGGIFQYVIINAETDPEVKIFDLRITEVIRDIQMRLRTVEYPPYQDKISKNVFTLDYTKLGFKEEPRVISPFTGHYLPLRITGDGKIIVDYASDLYQMLRENREYSLQKGEDIRWILTENSPFVPAYSLPYTVDEHGEPVFLE